MRLILTICTLAAVFVFAAATAFAGGSTSALVDVLHSKGVIDDASYNDLKKAEGEGEQSVNKKLIEVLHSKGVIDDASYSQLSAQAAAAPAAPQASAAPAERPLEKVLASLEEGFARAGGDTVKIKLGTWFQGGFLSDTNGSNTGSIPSLVAINPDSGNQFYTRYARIYFNAALDNKVGMRITLDGASSQVLQDAYLFTDYIPYTRITIGQYLIPYGDEYWRAPFDLPMINYALVNTMFVNNEASTATTVSGRMTNFVRDIGIMGNVKYMTKLFGRPFGGGIQTTVINGNGRNVADDNDQKDWTGRAYITPFVPGLEVGGTWYIGKRNFADSFFHATPDPRVTHKQDIQRWGAMLDYAPQFDCLKGLAIRGEFQYQRQFFVNAAQANADHSKAPAFLAFSPTSVIQKPRYFQSEGWYLEGLYRVHGLTGIWKYLNDFEPTYRYDAVNEDISVANKERTRNTIGLNYWLNKYCRLLANYEFIEAEDGLGAPTKVHPDRFTIFPNGTDTNNHQVFTFNYQVWF